MIIRLPYLSSSTLVYCLPCFNPRMVLICWISALPMICDWDASRTFSSLPRNGNTPNLSFPTTERPPSTSAFAESPSVKINVQCLLCPLTPARLASSSFGTLIRLIENLVYGCVGVGRVSCQRKDSVTYLSILVPSAFVICCDCLNSAHLITLSQIPLLRTIENHVSTL